ncbi:MAG TPA: ABC transporter ATP-binding protein [Gemmatimonadaceae bacterium]|nr:ABC transporter ATP-binding protein [Gemmatimonadaceae bacterium]
MTTARNSAGPASLTLDRITRRFAGQVAVHELSLEVRAGELLALVGASGSGKTTTLRMVAGYEQPDDGSIRLDGRDITTLPPEKRGFGMVFQHYALFPHLSVQENVGFGLEARGIDSTQRRTRALAALANVGLESKAARQVQALSGGEQQRVAMARAMVIEPRVLLLDEPLSNLDPTLREAMRTELRATLQRAGVTALFVTHDQEDAFAIADRVALLEHGRLLQHGTPEQLYDRPASRAVAEFIGRGVLLPAEDRGTHARITLGDVAQDVTVSRAGGDVLLPQALAVLRPESLEIGAADAAGGWPGRITLRRFAGAVMAYTVDVDGTALEVLTASRTAAVGDAVRVTVQREPVALVSA